VRAYKILSSQEFKRGEFRIIPIRHEDRYEIMKWRNEQIYHLRQPEPLTREIQDRYFEDVVAELFHQEQPNQVLFSFLQNDECVGYGGLVHINYIDLNAELSFVIKTELQEQNFETFWIEYLHLIKQPAFKELNLRKIYTYAFDVRERLYLALEKAGFVFDACLSDHCFVEGEFLDVLIHSFWNPFIKLKFRKAKANDVDLYFNWANDKDVRQNSFDDGQILYGNHLNWFKLKLTSEKTQLYIFEVLDKPVGQVRIDLVDGYWEIDYSVDACYRGLGVGKAMITQLIEKSFNLDLKLPLRAIVKSLNIASQRVFEQLGFSKKVEIDDAITYIYPL
jgi:RimJ/RimL family protein N-acetyltransferase